MLAEWHDIMPNDRQQTPKACLAAQVLNLRARVGQVCTQRLFGVTQPEQLAITRVAIHLQARGITRMSSH